MQFWCGTEVLDNADMPALAAFVEDAGFTGLITDDRWSGIEAIARDTESLRLVSNVCIAGRDLVLAVAHQWTSLTPRTRHRVALSIGVGWMAEEFEQFNQFENDGPRLAEMIGALREACRDDHRTVESRWTGSTPMLSVFGNGDSPPALRRAALYCDGWIGAPTPSSRVLPIVNSLVDCRRRSAPPGDTFDVVVSLADTPSADFCRYAEDSGVTAVLWSPRSVGPDDTRSSIEHFAESVIAYCS